MAIVQLSYSVATLYFVIMAAGFAMLEAGFVRAKNTTEILVKTFCYMLLPAFADFVVRTKT